ncbi:hypothetical protein CP500_009080 [Tychonema bourrellyi FEM_GT703]|uniref:DUF262 domain-containing protein n=1 Tax=Tychonema bourrellyi FEM_GT703 TaxID=2040638 RepID=A0A2G4F1X6_9CYAN|nr:hypothetical protein CP500_009080 [Tychonema bourrellyi FEM_GT703]
MAETYYFIKDLINDLERGRIRIMSFQRGFVWEPNRVSYFIDSIYRLSQKTGDRLYQSVN